MTKSIDTAYKELTRDMESAHSQVGDKLVQFSKNFSSDDELHFTSVLLQEEANVYFNNAELRKAILEKMSSVAAEIYQQVNAGNAVVTETYDLPAIQAAWSEKRRQGDIVFQCNGIAKSYARSGFRLHDIKLALRTGEITGVVGENGNGKSTLLKIIAGELYPEKKLGTLSYGALQTDNTTVDWALVKPQIAYLPQELGRLVGSVKKSIQYAAAAHGMTGSQNYREVNYIIQRLGLGKYENATWQELSGGYKLRFALARTLVWKPKLMVLDEPLANLDINTQTRVLNDLRDLCKSIKYPIAIILSSQNIEEVEAASDNMIVLKDGEITYQSPTSQIGQDRQVNMFEFRCNFTLKELTYCLRELDYTGLDFNGFSYFITTPLQVSELNFLQYCARKNISLSYFQDISVSTKKFITKTALA